MSQGPEPIEYASHGQPGWRGAAGVTFGPDGRPRSTSAWIAALKSIGVLVLWATFFVLVVVGLWHLHPSLAVFAVAAWFIVMPALDGMAREVRRRRATVILTYLSQAATLNLPLPRMLDAAQRSEASATGQRLRRLRDLLEDGAPLAVALPIASPEVPGRTVGLIAAAERLGRLPQALDRAVREQQTPAGGDPSRDAFARWYPILMTVALCGLLFLILVFIMPKFEQIYADFGLRLPPATLFLIQLGRGAFEYQFVPVLLGLFVLGLVGNLARGVIGGADNLGRIAVLDQLLWRVPVVHGFQRDRGLADAFQTIADALRTGRPLTRAVAEATTLRVNDVLKGRLRRWHLGLEEGLAADEAARRAGLPALVGGMIASGRGGDLAEAANFLAAYYAGRFSRAREVLRATSVPLLAILFGAVVMFVVAGMYEPILNLMDHLSVEALRVSR